MHNYFSLVSVNILSCFVSTWPQGKACIFAYWLSPFCPWPSLWMQNFLIVLRRHKRLFEILKFLYYVLKIVCNCDCSQPCIRCKMKRYSRLNLTWEGILNICNLKHAYVRGNDIKDWIKHEDAVANICNIKHAYVRWNDIKDWIKHEAVSNICNLNLFVLWKSQRNINSNLAIPKIIRISFLNTHKNFVSILWLCMKNVLL